MAKIQVRTKNGNVQEHDLGDKPEITIGRLKGNDLVLPEGIVSKKHAQLLLQGDKYFVKDLGSTCGTWVNGLRITDAQAIGPSDTIYIGDYQLTLDLGEQALSEADLEEDADW